MREVRYLTTADHAAYAEIAAYSYNLVPQDIFDILERAKRSGDLALGAFEDGRLAAAMLDRRFAVNVNGASVPANGIGMVASSPETRRRGLVREMLSWHIGQLRREGVVLSLLYPFRFRFYNRMGWGFASRQIQVRVPVREFAGYGRDTGRIRRLMVCTKEGPLPEPGLTKEQIVAALQQIYLSETRSLNLSASREPRDWDRLLDVDSGRRYVYGWESDEGRIEGYYIGMTRGEEYPNDLRVREMFAASPDAWRGLFWFLAGHDSHIKEVRLMLPPEHQILELITEPRLDAKLEHGPMARAVDVAGLLQARGMDGVAAGSCVIRVSDELAPWNDGWFEVSVGEAPGQSAATGCGGKVVAARIPVREGEPGPAADVTLPVDVFSQVCVGVRSLAEMERYGLAETVAGPGLEFARTLFPARQIWHKEYY